MSVSRIFCRATRKALLQCRNSLLLSPPDHHHNFSMLANHFRSLHQSPVKGSRLHDLLYSTSANQCFGISTSASPQPSEKEPTQARQEQGNSVKFDGEAMASSEADETAAQQNQEPGSSSEAQTNSQSAKRRRSSKRTAFSDSDSEGDLDDLSKDDLVKLVLEKEEFLKAKEKEIAAMHDKVLRSYAEMENVMDRTRRESENSKKFAIQSFAKSLLDVADNLGRASSVVKGSFARIDTSQDTTGAAPLLKTLLEGVEMTEKQLLEVFRKFGMEKYDPVDEQFDPNRHNAVFQVPDNSKPSGTVAVVLKLGYTLHDRVIRPAEVGVTQAAEKNEAD